MKKPHLLVRVDGNARIGFGHVMRSLALGQAWLRAGGEIQYAVAAENEHAQKRLSAAGFPVSRIESAAATSEDAQKTKNLAKEWVVVDGYEFNDDYTACLKQPGARILVVDDDGNSSWRQADLILNQNLHANAGMYAGSTASEFCLGPEFALLRSEFVRRERSVPQEARRILITLGGGDQSDVATKILAPFRSAEWSCCEILVLSAGPVNGGPHIGVLKSSDQMADLMRWADVAISGAGSTVWELCFIGTPFVTVVLAPNQEEIAASLEREGIADIAGKITALDPAAIAGRVMSLVKDFNRRVKISEAQQRLVDGEGARRVVAKMLEQSAMARSH